ncbi:MAG: thiamine phosphate synthase [Armatimonadota bacterium]
MSPARQRWPESVLMLVTDRKRCGERSLPEVVEAAIEGGVNVVQLRERDLPAGELLKLARQLRGVCGTRALLLINDRVDVAILSGADGVHLGENGLPVAAVRQMLPPSMLVGRSAHSKNSARQADLDGADYLVVGTIFPSPSHPDAEPAGEELLRDVSTRTQVPVIAIGGVTAENAASCFAAGASGIAVVSAILGSDDPRAAAQRLAPTLPETAPEPAASPTEEEELG